MKLIENTYQFFCGNSIEEKTITDKLLEGIDITEDTKENAQIITNKILDQPINLQIHIISDILNEYYELSDISNKPTSKLFQKVLSNRAFDNHRKVIYIFVDKEDMTNEEFSEELEKLKQILGIEIYKAENHENQN